MDEKVKVRRKEKYECKDRKKKCIHNNSREREGKKMGKRVRGVNRFDFSRWRTVR